MLKKGNLRCLIHIGFRGGGGTCACESRHLGISLRM